MSYREFVQWCFFNSTEPEPVDYQLAQIARLVYASAFKGGGSRRTEEFLYRRGLPTLRPQEPGVPAWRRFKAILRSWAGAARKGGK
jgi:hypothetical protein